MPPPPPGLWQARLQIGQWLTDAIGINASSSTTPALQLLIVPGNPGLAGFYKVFIQELHSLFRGTADVWAVSNLGHDAEDLTSGRVWCLDTQVQHKVQLLKDHVMAPGKPPAVILAHSIGSYIMLKAIKQLEEERAAAGQTPADTAQQMPRVLLLMPFLATDWSSTRQHFLKFAARLAPVLGAAVGLLNRLPERLLQGLIALAEPTAEPHTREGIRALLNRNGVRNNFRLAYHEFRDLDRPVDWDLIRRLGRRAVVVCAPDDIWYPMHHYYETQTAVPGIEEYYNSELTHGFCCHTRQCHLVAQLVALSVKKALHPADINADDQQPEVGNAAADVSVLLEAADGREDGTEEPAGPAGAQQEEQQQLLLKHGKKPAQATLQEKGAAVRRPGRQTAQAVA